MGNKLILNKESSSSSLPIVVASICICLPEQKSPLGPTLRAVIHTLALISMITLIREGSNKKTRQLWDTVSKIARQL